MENFSRIIKEFVVEVGNNVRHNAILDVCCKRDYGFDDGENKVLIYCNISLTELNTFFEEVDEREERLKNIPNISLTEEQKVVVEKVMDMLADANIGMCHDNLSTGELGFFNSINGKLYASDDIGKYDDVFFDKDTIKGNLYIISPKCKGKHIYSFYSNGGFVMEK